MGELRLGGACSVQGKDGGKMTEFYISVDVETDGPIPGPNSMLSLGAAAFTESGLLQSTFTVNLELLPGAIPDPGTMQWWETQPEAWAAHRQNLFPPEAGMKGFARWVASLEEQGLSGKPVFIAYPAGFDFTWGYWYMMRFVGTSPFSFSALDIKSYACAKLGTPFREVSKKTLDAYLPKDRKHTHVAVDDAIEQGMLFFNLRAL